MNGTQRVLRNHILLPIRQQIPFNIHPHEIAHHQVPVAADECVRDTAAAHRLRALAAADAIVLKLQPLGGFRAALDVAAAAGVPAIVTSMMETSVGIAAGLALAAALPELPYACGLATVPFLDGDVTHAPLVADDGELRVRRVVPDPDCLARYADSSQG